MSVYIAVPYTRPFFGSFIDSLLYCDKPDTFMWKRLPFMGVDVARNALTKWFLLEELKPEFLLFIDNDATWHPKAITRLMSHNLPMVCGCMYTRDLPPSPTWGQFVGPTKDKKLIYRYGESARRVVRRMRSLNFTQPEGNAICLEQTPDDLWEIDGCGMHFTMIRRDVIEALQEPYFLDENGSGAGEDFYFSRKVKAAGYPIYVDESIHTGHSVGEGQTFGIRELLEYSKYVTDPELEMVDDLGVYEI